MRTLSSGRDSDSIVGRLELVCSDDAARWGKMNAHQMVRHLADSMRGPLGEFWVSDAEMTSTQRTVMKWAALYFPMKWPKGVATRPEIDQSGKSAPGDFDTDRSLAIGLVSRMCATDLAGARHPIFGPLTQLQWLRWAWLHADHHLRQFGR
jgi:hypothetical protein